MKLISLTTCSLLLALCLGCHDAGPGSAVDVTSLRGQPINPLPPTKPASNAVVEAASTPATVTNVALVPETVTSPPAFKEGYNPVGFDQLSGYKIEITDEILNPPTNATRKPLLTAESQIPKTIRELNETQVAIKGFMLPLKVEGGKVTELLIMKDQSMCCFGVTPQIHEWVSVIMEDEGIRPVMDEAVTLFGRLHVGEMRENGYLVGIYAMDGQDMDAPEQE